MNKIVLILLLATGLSYGEIRQVNLDGTNKVKYTDLHLVLGQNTFHLNTPYNGRIGEWFVNVLSHSRYKGYKNIYLVIDSPGGYVTDGLAAISAMKLFSSRYGIKTVCVINELAASMAAVHSAFCDETVMNQYGALMHHLPAYGIGGAARNLVQERYRFSENWLNLVEEKLALQYGLSVEQYNEFIKAERWFTAIEAAKFGLVDKVVRNLILENPYE